MKATYFEKAAKAALAELATFDFEAKKAELIATEEASKSFFALAGVEYSAAEEIAHLEAIAKTTFDDLADTQIEELASHYIDINGIFNFDKKLGFNAIAGVIA